VAIGTPLAAAVAHCAPRAKKEVWIDSAMGITTWASPPGLITTWADHHLGIITWASLP